MTAATSPLVGVVMGSDSDWNVMREASELLDEFGMPHEVEVVSAHRTPEKMIAYGKQAADRGLKVIIAGAGGAAHLPGMLASVTTLPVIGVPVPLSRLDGLDSLLSIVQMPAGVPVATVSIGGAKNAGLLAVRILATSDAALSTALADYATALAALVEEKNERLKSSTMSLAASPIRYPDLASRTVMTRRAWWLVVLNFLIPGSAQVLAGDRKLGRFGLGATLALWVLAVAALVVLDLLARGALHDLLDDHHALGRRGGARVLRGALGRAHVRHAAARAAREDGAVGTRLGRRVHGRRDGDRVGHGRVRRVPRDHRERVPLVGVRRGAERAARSTAGTTSCCSAATPDPIATACGPTASRW